MTYAYSATGCTWGAMTADLCSVTDPLGNTTDYTYDSGNANTTLDYDILTVTPPGAIGDYVNTYDSAGRVTSQTDPKGDLTRFAYGVGATGQTTTTVSTYPAGSSNPPDVTEYDYWNNVLTSEVTGVDTGDPAVQSFLRDPSSLLDETYTDGDGNAVPDTFSSSYVDSSGTPNEPDILTSADALGNTTEAAYNADNQVWCSVDAADYANGTRCPSITPPTSIPGTSYLGTRINVYNASDQLIASIDPLGNTTTYSYTSSGGSEPAGLMYCSVDPADYNKSVSCPAYAAAHVSGTATSTFDAAGDVLSTTDADGHVTSYTYSTSNPGLVATETSQDETVTTYTYDAAGQVTLQVVTFDSYSATTQYSYDASERLVCEVDPYEYAASVRCPTGAITTPTVGSDSYLGATITTYNADDQVNQTTNPLGGITYTAYDPAGEVYCTVAPYEAAQSVTCPALPITTPTVGSDSYLGATITTYNANGEVAQVTNPLGGITLTTYDPAGNVDTTTVESNNSTSDPNLVTAYTYNADNEVYETVVGSGSSAATTLQRYDPNGNVFCSVSANAHNFRDLAVPDDVAGGVDHRAPEPDVAVLDDADIQPGEQRHDGVLRRGRRRGADDRPGRRDIHHRLRRRRPELLHLGPGERGRLAHPPLVEHVPVSVPEHAADDRARHRFAARLHDDHLRRGRAHALADRPVRQHHELCLRLGRPQELDDRRHLENPVLLLLPGLLRTVRLRRFGDGWDRERPLLRDAPERGDHDLHLLPGWRCRRDGFDGRDDHQRLRRSGRSDLGDLLGHRGGLHGAPQRQLHLLRRRHPRHHDRRDRHHDLYPRRHGRHHDAGLQRRQRLGAHLQHGQLHVLFDRTARLGRLPQLHRPQHAVGDLHLRLARQHGVGDRLARQRGHLLP